METTLAHLLGCNNEALPSLAEFAEDAPERVGTEIANLFEHAMTQRLKWPRIRLLTRSGQVIVLRRAGERSRHPGSIQILGEGHYPANDYFGRIETDGTLRPARAMTLDVRELLGRLARDPAQVAFEYGKLTGHCCFCNRELTDPRSASHGYGPDCAEHYALPWNARRDLGGFYGNVFNVLEGVPAYE